MNKLMGSLLAGLLVFQGSLPSLGLHQPVTNFVAVGVAMGVAAIGFYLKKAPE